MKTKKRGIYIFAAPLMTVIIMLLIYTLKGIYPFGTGNIQGGDLYQLYVPNFLHIREAILNGEPFFDFSSACGIDRQVLVYLFQPTTWFFLLFSEKTAVYAVSLLIVAKMALIALCASYSFSKIYPKLSPYMVVLTGLIYTFSGYNIQYYTNIGWLDCVALYPLLIAALLHMFRGKSKLPFVLVLTYSLCVQTYISFFFIISLIVFGGVYLFTVKSGEERKKCIFSLGTGTLISLICSAYPIYNFSLTAFGSARYSEYSASGLSGGGLLSSYKLILSTVGYKTFYVAVMMFIGAELAFACLGIMTMYSFKNKRFRKHTAFFLISAMLLGIQTVCLNCELLWHGGSRVMFPFRNGFMVSFLACLIIGFYYSKARKKIDSGFLNTKYANPYFFIMFACAAGVSVYCCKKYLSIILEKYRVTATYQHPKEIYVPFVVAFIVLTVMFMCLMLARYKGLRALMTFGCVFALIIANSYAFVGNPEGSKAADAYNKYYSDCFEAGELIYYSDCFEAGELIENKDVFRRVSNPDISLLTNYSYFAGTSSVSNWVNNLDNEHMAAFQSLGFSTIFTRTNDTGATAFSKALMRITDSVAKADLNPELYVKSGESKSGIKSYKNRYTMPFGLNFDSGISTVKYEDYSNTFDYQNEIYYYLSGDSGLFEKTELYDTETVEKTKPDYYAEKGVDASYLTGTVNCCTAKLKTKKNTTLYAHFVNAGEDTYFYKLSVDGSPFIAYRNPEAPNRDTNTYFPHDYNKNVMEIGTFDGEEVDVSFDIVNGNSGTVEFWLMDNTKLGELCDSFVETEYSRNGDSISVTADCDNGIFFIPVTYSEKWSCTVNGKEVKPEKVLGSFIGVKTEQGRCEIKLTFSHKAAYLNFISVFAAFASAAALVFIERRIKKYPKLFYNLAYYAFTGLIVSVYVLVYGIPLLAFIAYRF